MNEFAYRKLIVEENKLLKELYMLTIEQLKAAASLITAQASLISDLRKPKVEDDALVQAENELNQTVQANTTAPASPAPAPAS